MKARVTIKDIAKKLNITAATVSRALNDHPEINAQTRQLVKDTANRMHYTPNRIGRALQSGSSKLIGVMIPTAEHPFFGSVIHGISTAAGKSNYDVLIYQSDESQALEEKGINTFIRAQVDGILISISKSTTDFSHIQKAVDHRIPVVFFDRTSGKLDLPSVTIDDYTGAYLATRHLFDQGYRRIAHIAGPQHITAFQQRKKGYLAALKDCRLPSQRNFILEGDVSLESGEKALDRLFSLPVPPDAVFAVEDFTALGVIKAAKEKGLQLPEELGVFGFCNDIFSAYVTPSISTIDQQTVKMGEQAFQLLITLLNAGVKNRQTHSHIVLEPIMVVRESSKKRQISQKL